MESPGESRHPQERLSVGEGKQCGQGFERMGLQRGLGVGDRGSERERSGAKIISDRSSTTQLKTIQSHFAITFYKMNIRINCISHFSEVLQKRIL